MDLKSSSEQVPCVRCAQGRVITSYRIKSYSIILRLENQKMPLAKLWIQTWENKRVGERRIRKKIDNSPVGISHYLKKRRKPDGALASKEIVEK